MTLLLSPLTLFLVALCVGGLALSVRRRGLAFGALLLAILALAAMTPLGANALVGAVESRVRAAPGACEDLHAVVFLSGGVLRAPDSSADLAALTPDTVARIFGLVQHERRLRLPLVVSGGGPHSIAESDVIATLMLQLGTEPTRVVLEPHSRSTWDSARAVAGLLPPSQRRVALASSALHLPRAMLVYRAAGFTVCPWPLSWRRQHPAGIGALVPQSSALLKGEAALYELAGDLYYRARLLLGEDSSPR